MTDGVINDFDIILFSNVGDRFIPGHESGGRVVEVGRAVTQVSHVALSSWNVFRF